MEEVILVNEQDHEVGTLEKMEAHRQGLLHRAFSILLFNSKGELLLQQRALEKYHSGGLWSNTCCSHPRPGEAIESAVRRKLMQEMGIEADLSFAFKFIYRTPLCDLVEYECDHVFVGTFDGEPVININEVADWKFMPLNILKKELAEHPERYTFWLREIVQNYDLPVNA